MEYERFVTIVEHEGGGLNRPVAERATQATLQTLAERLSPGEARDLVRELPGTGPWLFTDRPPEPLDFDEFLRRVAEREGVNEATAERHARAVFAALGRAVSAEELDDLLAELPQDYEPLRAEAEWRFDHIMPAGDFLRRVTERAADLGPDGARRATDAVLETLAERIAPGEVDDLVSHLPRPLHDPLKRGKQRHGTGPKRMPWNEFVRQVTEREGLPVEQLLDRGFEHVRAVFLTLRDALGLEQFAQVTTQLPPQYAVFWTAGAG